MKFIQRDIEHIHNTDTIYETPYDDSFVESSFVRNIKTAITQNTDDEPDNDWPMENTYIRDTPNEDSTDDGGNATSTNLENDQHDWPTESAYLRSSL
ncbi:hypothetical protein DPMN_033019 [Dreissena polymorpha]|uniref:Uncharacterized protein n=1 Tax=Dreissena polymorpha TaxID=45954 RepID=A0A9D4RJG7_DREPO|nr:hypothetical protein DPMN_033019 [Dreissena polymorpha]